MITVGNVYDYLCQLAPIELKMDFDNCGFQVGHRCAEVKTILVTLDITSEVIKEAINKKAELIVSHHPVIFYPIKALTDDTPDNTRQLLLAENKIAAVCMHTNLDIAEGGVNDALLSKLCLSAGDSFDECGRIGEFERDMPLADFLNLCKSRLNANGIRYYNSGRSVKRLAVMGGAGGGAVEEAHRLGCDTYLTSDIKHDQFITAQELGINLVDGGHFCTEYPIVPVLAEKLKAQFPKLEVVISEKNRQIPQFI